MTLKQDDFPVFYGQLTAPLITDKHGVHVDCGTKCVDPGEVPYCCNGLLPSMYDAEFAYTKNAKLKDLKGDTIWHEWKPSCKSEEKYYNDLSEGEVYVECTGVDRCNRKSRGMICRTYPMHPYFNEQGEFIGITPILEGHEKHCWVMNNLSQINPEWVAQYEELTYHVFSKSINDIIQVNWGSKDARKSAKRNGQKVNVVLFEGQKLKKGTVEKAVRLITRTPKEEPVDTPLVESAEERDSGNGGSEVGVELPEVHEPEAVAGVAEGGSDQVAGAEVEDSGAASETPPPGVVEAETVPVESPPEAVNTAV